jgi:hypothetical protein
MLITKQENRIPIIRRVDDQFKRAALCGALAGIGAGVMIAITEYMKVTIQVEGGSVRNVIQSKSFW